MRGADGASVTAVAGSAADAVTGLVSGEGAKTEESAAETKPEKSEEEKRLDREIDGKSEPAVEGFLREKTATGGVQ